MKEYTFKQIRNTFAKAVKEDYGQKCTMMKNLSRAPFCTTVLNLTITFTLKYGNGNKYFEVPINIMVKQATFIQQAICMEVATLLRKFGGLEYYRDDPKPLEFSDINIEVHKAMSFTEYERKYAIFHVEQECGYSWFTIAIDELSAPFTYQEDYHSNKLTRSMTNSVKSKYIYVRQSTKTPTKI